MKLIYSVRADAKEEGFQCRNPRFFDTPESDVNEVVIDGEYPDIEAAYTALGVTVSKKSASKKAKGKKSEKSGDAEAKKDADNSEAGDNAEKATDNAEGAND